MRKRRISQSKITRLMRKCYSLTSYVGVYLCRTMLILDGEQYVFPVYEPDPDALRRKYKEAEEEARAHHYDASKEGEWGVVRHGWMLMYSPHARRWSVSILSR